MPATNAVRSIQEVFREFVLEIPNYQRGYAWEEKEIADFLEDLELLADGKVHYTGTLILDPTARRDSEIEDAFGTVFRRASVVDGQQRLTTIVLLIAAISRAVSDQGQADLADGLYRTYVETRTAARQPLLKLRLNHDSNAFWERSIVADTPAADPPAIVSHRRLLAARQQVDRYLADAKAKLGDEYVSWLNVLREKVTKQLRLTVYEVDDSAEVGVIFETQNDRGRPLTDLEKTKNLLLYIAFKVAVPDHGLGDLVDETWTRLLQELSSRDLARPEDEDALLRCHWLITYNPRPRDWARFDSIKSRFSLRRYKDDQTTLVDEVRHYLKTLSDCVGPYCDALSPTHSEAFGAWFGERKLRNEIVEYSDKLARIGAMANLVPLLVACRLRTDIGPGEYLDILRHLEIFSFRSRAMRSRSDAGQGDLFPLANRLRRSEASVDDVRSTLGWLTRYYGGAVFLRLTLGTKHDSYQWSLVRYVLYEYEIHRAKAHQHAPQMSWQVIDGRSLEQSIEHILPQTATDPYWLEKFDAAARQQLVHDLGNLCLTYNNSSYKNKAFPEKRGQYGQSTPCYANSPLYQERDLVEYADWTPASVQHRRDQLLAFLWDRWQVEEVSAKDLAAAGIVVPREEPTQADGSDD
jgi:hypothetical protein